MKLAVMQPYFFPYLGYFELIAKSDKWLLFDVVQYTTKSWITRNRILHPEKGWQYINIPVVKMPRETLIRDIVIVDAKASLERLLGQLSHYRKSAPNYRSVVELMRSIFTSINSNSLCEFNDNALKLVCEYIGIAYNSEICSEMDINYGHIEHPGQWALKIAKHVKADAYINPPSGVEIFEQKEWDKAGIALEFNDMPEFIYDTNGYDYSPYLSIVDVLMWNNANTIKDYLLRVSK